MQPQYKVFQLYMLARSIEKLKEEFSITKHLIAGDFNLVPNSMLYKLITEADFNLDIPKRFLSNQELMIAHCELKHSLELHLIDCIKKFSYKSLEMTAEELQKVFFKRDPMREEEKQEILQMINLVSNFDFELDFTQKAIRLKKKLEYDEKNPVNKLKNLFQSLGLKSGYSEAIRLAYLYQKNDKEFLSVTSSNDFLKGNCIHEPYLTHFTADFKATVDYLFYEKNSFEVNKILRLPNFKQISEIDSKRCLISVLPNWLYPSDHFSLAFEMEIV